jgi:hypothetical protein
MTIEYMANAGFLSKRTSKELSSGRGQSFFVHVLVDAHGLAFTQLEKMLSRL